jgi:hypothetical protein
MTRVTVDTQFQQLVSNCTAPLELCDASGSILGRFIPAMPPIVEEDWIDLTPDLTDEELEAEIDAGEGYSTQELIDEIKRMRGL